MSEAALDRLLAVLLAAIMATGLLTWRSGTPETQWVYALHGLLSGVLLAAVALKLRRSLPRAIAARRWAELALGILLGVAALASLGIGFIWVAGGRFIQVGPWTLLGWHTNVAWAVTVLAIGHLLVRRRWRILRPRALITSRTAGAGAERAGMHLAPWESPPSGRVRRPVSRRAVLVAGGLTIAGAVVWDAAEVLDRLGGTPRRFTGSRWLPSGGVPTPTTFLGEGTPVIDAAAWRLRVTGAVERPLELSLAELTALGVTEQACVLDCTGGWAMETTWRGVPMTALLDASGIRRGARTVSVVSVTGWSTPMSTPEARDTLLAIGVAGIDLPAGNGAPCRLVVPTRRGVDWVKWVAEVRVA